MKYKYTITFESTEDLLHIAKSDFAASACAVEKEHFFKTMDIALGKHHSRMTQCCTYPTIEREEIGE